jgi:hypothetical protein
MASYGTMTSYRLQSGLGSPLGQVSLAGPARRNGRGDLALEAQTTPSERI